NDTIVAPATPLGVGAIGIVRMSGREAISIASRLFRARSGKKVEDFSSFRFYLGDLIDPEKEFPLDEALCVVMRAPRSYTREDVVEFHLHGGPLLLRKVFELCLREGARMARPGEFTERAFLNGRIDLTQAEAVAEIVRARSEKALELSLRALKGEWGQKVRSWQDKLVFLQAHVQVSCDFPEASVPDVEGFLLKELYSLREVVEQEIKNSERTQVLQDGFLVVIAGKPNVGKSSLLNIMVGKERAIVTPFPGTTRDAIEEVVLLEGLPIRFVDTAGIRDSTDFVEQAGVEKTQEYLRDADLVIVLFDRSRPLEEDDARIAHVAGGKPHIVVFNKSDLPSVLSKEEIYQFYPGEEIIEISARSGEGKETLVSKIVEKLRTQIGPEEHLTLMSAHQKEKLKAVASSLAELEQEIRDGVSLDIVGLRLDEILRAMRQITGENIDGKLLKTIFSHFCLGK
ncbi:MAG: tRNA uridine-5-carboxymethylaminomethyl(34) synthesis GTPase MnmE, partial [Atribacterota bacterium]|nr:tRNA uridine-5-carboxymethylaminomethyl(34) synthesis GTPase MnmE [Atribacterota bacterium]